MKKTFIALSLLTTAFTATSVAAQDSVRWDQLSAGYEQLKIDDTDLNLSGLRLSGTKEFAKNFFVTGSYSALQDDIDGFGDVEFDEARFGVGFYNSLTSKIDVSFAIGYIDQKATLDGLSDSADGYSATAALRYAVDKNFELGFVVERFDVDDTTDTKFGAEVRLNVSTNVALALNYSRFDEANSFSAGATYYF